MADTVEIKKPKIGDVQAEDTEKLRDELLAKHASIQNGSCTVGTKSLDDSGVQEVLKRESDQLKKTSTDRIPQPILVQDEEDSSSVGEESQRNDKAG